MPDETPKQPWPHPVVFVDPKRLDLIKGYVLNEQRTPGAGRLVCTPSQTIGPFFPVELLPAEAHDLTRKTPGGAVATGIVIEVGGSVLDQAGEPVPGALVEIWQANAWGKYDHPRDRSDLPVDPNFRGFGQVLADEAGRYRFRTIRPAAYPNPGYDDWLRPPHIHFSVFGAGLMERLITQMYFPGEALNDIDPILNAVADLDIRARLIAVETPRADAATPRYGFDIVLRGDRETPFFSG